MKISELLEGLKDMAKRKQGQKFMEPTDYFHTRSLKDQIQMDDEREENESFYNMVVRWAKQHDPDVVIGFPEDLGQETKLAKTMLYTQHDDDDDMYEALKDMKGKVDQHRKNIWDSFEPVMSHDRAFPYAEVKHWSDDDMMDATEGKDNEIAYIAAYFMHVEYLNDLMFVSSSEDEAATDIIADLFEPTRGEFFKFHVTTKPGTIEGKPALRIITDDDTFYFMRSSEEFHK